MNKEDNNMKKTLKALVPVMFILYLAALIWVIVFKANRDLLLYGGEPEYRQISFYLSFNGRETLLNIAAFVPAGLFLMLLSRRENKLAAGIGCFLISLAFEVTQYILMLGTSDLTDLITNTMGGLVGIAAFLLCKRIFREKTQTILSLLCIPATLAFCFVSTFLV